MQKKDQSIVIVPSLEEFSRSKRPGLAVWGNEVTSDIQLDKWEKKGGLYVPKS